jgi:hypothetical protein
MLFTFCIVVFSQLKSWCFRTHPTSVTSLPSQGRHFPVHRPLHRHGRVQIRRRKKRRLALLVAFAPGGPRDATVATDGADGAADLAFSKCCGVPYPYYTYIYISIYIYNNIDIVDLFVEGQRYIKRTWCKQNGSNGQYLYIYNIIRRERSINKQYINSIVKHSETKIDNEHQFTMPDVCFFVVWRFTSHRRSMGSTICLWSSKMHEEVATGWGSLCYPPRPIGWRLGVPWTDIFGWIIIFW